MIQTILIFILFVLSYTSFSQNLNEISEVKEFVRSDKTFIEYSNQYSKNKTSLKINSFPYSICSLGFFWKEYFPDSIWQKCEKEDRLKIESTNSRINGLEQLSDKKSYSTLSFSEKVNEKIIVHVISDKFKKSFGATELQYLFDFSENKMKFIEVKKVITN